MASLSLNPHFETNLMSNRSVIGLLLQLKSAKAHGKNYMSVKAHLVHHLLHNRLFFSRSLIQKTLAELQIFQYLKKFILLISNSKLWDLSAVFINADIYFLQYKIRYELNIIALIYLLPSRPLHFYFVGSVSFQDFHF